MRFYEEKYLQTNAIAFVLWRYDLRSSRFYNGLYARLKFVVAFENCVLAFLCKRQASKRTRWKSQEKKNCFHTEIGIRLKADKILISNESKHRKFGDTGNRLKSMGGDYTIG